MKTMATCAAVILFSLSLMAEEMTQPYLIQRGEEIIEVHNMPKFTASEPISNSFVYINGEYIPSPYIVSVTNLSIFINERLVQNYESSVRKRESYPPGTRTGHTPELIGRDVDFHCESLTMSLIRGRVLQFYRGGQSNSGMDDGSSALARIELARKATKGDEQAKQALIQQMNLKDSLSHVHPDWIERLATNTNLETRATVILEAKREREQRERERREQQTMK